MTEREWALLFHLAGVVLLFSGLILAAAALAAARRREVAGEIAALLGLTRFGVALVAAGALLLVGTGLWLVEVWDGAYALGDVWIAASLGLWRSRSSSARSADRSRSRRASLPREAAAQS